MGKQGFNAAAGPFKRVGGILLALGMLSCAWGIARAWAQEAPSLEVPSLPPADAPFMSVDEIRPGMPVVAYTVFSGNRIEPFTGIVRGVAEGYLGPQRDVILVEFEEPRLKHVGIVHGMSGSPVYIDGKLIGALSLALSPFPKDALGGVTPIAYMVDEGQERGAGPGTPSGDARTPTRLGWVAPSSRLPSAAARPGEASSLIRDPAGLPSPGSSGFSPLRTPLVFHGVDAAVFDHFRSAFTGFPLLPRLGGGGGGHLEAASGTTRELAAASLVPGSAVAGVLVEGDASIVATGTVTWRDGNRLYAFGHPFLQQGPSAIPMGTAEVIATVADQTYPYKMANLGTLVGTITHDRVTAVVGAVGPEPPMIPVIVRVERSGEPSTTFRYRMVESRELAPILLQLVVANSFKKQWRYLNDGTYQVSTRIRMAGGQEVLTRTAYTFAPVVGGDTIFNVANELAGPFTALHLNPFQPVEIDQVEVVIAGDPVQRMYYLDQVQVSQRTLRPGAQLQATISVQPYLGAVQARRVAVPIPAGSLPGELLLRVVDARSASRVGRVGGGPDLNQARDLPQLIAMLNRGRSSDALFVQLLRPSPGLALQHQELTSLPGSVRAVLERAPGNENATVLEHALLWEQPLPFDGVVLGETEVRLEVLPQL